MNGRKIKGGVYLVIDPSMDQGLLFSRLQQVLQEKIAAVQIWDHWKDTTQKKTIIEKVCSHCHSKNIPVLMNNDWQLLKEFPIDGVHFDEIPSHLEAIKEELERHPFIGITVNNDLAAVEWADKNKLDYISFCSMFPSTTATSCELVSFDTVRKARQITPMPIFLAGGINPGNMNKLKELDFDGVAVVSGIMSQEEPANAVKKYSEQLIHTL